MPRRLGSAVPSTVSRLLQAGYIRSPPAWFDAVSSVAPQRPSLTRRMPAGSSNTSIVGGHASTSQTWSKLVDGSVSASAGHDRPDPFAWQGSRKIKDSRSTRYRPPKPAPLQGYRVRDAIRKQLFRDHPFEGYRGINLVESDQVQTHPGPAGSEWTELRQRSRNPSPDDAVDFILNFHQSHHIPLALAYSAGVQQFQSLRASHETSLHSAQVEAEAYGMTWPTEFSAMDRLIRAEDNNLLEGVKGLQRGEGSVAAATAALPGQGASSGGLLESAALSNRGWSAGAEYLQGRRVAQKQETLAPSPARHKSDPSALLSLLTPRTDRKRAEGGQQ